MNKYNPKIHHRRSIRLKGYDYSQAGLYFITICCQDRTCMYGEITNGQVKLNDAGKMIEKWYYELENKFPDVKCHAMIVMPNHFHCILENVGAIGADLRVSPYRTPTESPPNTGLPPNDESSPNAGLPPNDESPPNAGLPPNGESPPNTCLPPNGESRPNTESPPNGDRDEHACDRDEHACDRDEHACDRDEHVGSPLSHVVQWFKTMTTNEYIRGVKNSNWQPFRGKLWQRNYYEHIIRNDQSYHRIAKYIIDNPAKWIDKKSKNY